MSSKSSLPERVKRYLAQKAAAKRAFDRAERMLAEVASSMKPGQEVKLDAEKTAVLRDKFEGKDVLWGHGAVRRWEIEVIEE